MSLYKTTLRQLNDDRDVIITAEASMLTIYQAEKLRKKGCDVQFKHGKVKIKRIK